jgi:single stranded DNA-binding protein
MSQINIAIICGNVTRDAVVKQIPSNGTYVVEFGVASTRTWTKEDGSKGESTFFGECRFFTTVATLSRDIASRARRGMGITVYGSNEMDRWTDAKGEKHSKHFIRVINFQPHVTA